MWTDNETDGDLLGLEIHANFVRSIVNNRMILSATVGLFEDWGGGKSSILKLLKLALHIGDPETLPIYFDTWGF